MTNSPGLVSESCHESPFKPQGLGASEKKKKKKKYYIILVVLYSIFFIFFSGRT